MPPFPPRLRLACTVLLFFVCTLRAPAAEPVELIPGLTYLRITHYTADSAHLAAALSANRPLIVDVRYSPAESAADFPFEALLGQRAPEATAALYFLVSPETPAALASVLRTLPRGAVTLGIEGAQPAPGVIIAQAADVDRRAHDAWSEKIPLAALITGKIGKERFDEAALVKEFRNGGSPAAPPAIVDPATAKDGERVPVLTDRVLQRAVHLHRALLALKQR